VRGLFVTGTDTGVGKSVVAAAICASLVARGETVAAFKPAVTGLDEPPAEWPHDHNLLAAVANAGQSPEDVTPYRFGPAVSPDQAAERAGVAVEPERILAAAARAAASADVLVVEGVGGVLVPLAATYLIRDLALELTLPMVVASRPGLGTINHTLLTVEALCTVGLEVAEIVLTPWREPASRLERANRRSLERLSGLPVTGLPAAGSESLAAAGDVLVSTGALTRAGLAIASG
jgi:dethiobiotin synthetase